jgi:hypothetical protein
VRPRGSRTVDPDEAEALRTLPLTIDRRQKPKLPPAHRAEHLDDVDAAVRRSE